MVRTLLWLFFPVAQQWRVQQTGNVSTITLHSQAQTTQLKNRLDEIKKASAAKKHAGQLAVSNDRIPGGGEKGHVRKSGRGD